MLVFVRLKHWRSNVKAALYALLAGLSLVLIGTATATAAATPRGGVIHVYVVPGNGQGNGTILVVGAIGDYGKTHKAIGEIGKVLLHKGTFDVNLKAINEKINHAKPIVESSTTCSGAFSATAPAKLFNGTGAYKGISGTIMLTETFAGYGPFYKNGPHKGQCEINSPNATPIAQWGSVTGVGTVKYA
jgi:hypothetical protein